MGRSATTEFHDSDGPIDERFDDLRDQILRRGRTDVGDTIGHHILRAAEELRWRESADGGLQDGLTDMETLYNGLETPVSAAKHLLN